AVLPFKLLTPNAEDDYLSVALADAVINHLSASGELLVRPASTVQRYAKQMIDPLVAARELNVQVVVDGSIQKFGPKLRVHFQAWNATDGASLLSAKHESEMADLFGLQDKIGEDLARTLRLKTLEASAEPVEPPTKNTVAYQLYLRAAERLAKLNRWDTHTAIELLEEATRLDPRFADAWAHLAEARLMMAITFDPKPEWMRRARQAVRRAVGLNPVNAEAQCARGRFLWSPGEGFQNGPALRALSKSLQINPGCYQARIWLAIIYLHVGLLSESMEQINASLAVNPDDAYTLYARGQAATYQGDYLGAQDSYLRSLAIDPSHLFATLLLPGLAIYMGRFELAEEKIRIARQMAPRDSILSSWEALIWAKRGEKRKAEQACRRVMRERKVFTYTHHAWHNVAASLAVLGKSQEAVTLLRKASKTGLPNYPGYRDDPHFGPMQNYPPYLRLLADLKRESDGYRREFCGA
ncbi:MAG TPA: tetratricopeptide repeat protein, partial [Candidatus Methylomirabilis sp.]|nr:tetratricopeptide repeat protein [Candidatus Methylomirabilis sp.]